MSYNNALTHGHYWNSSHGSDNVAASSDIINLQFEKNLDNNLTFENSIP
jgi:hypothetical protein